MFDQEIAVSGEPYMKKSKLLALAQEYLFEPLSKLFGRKKKDGDEEDGTIEPLDVHKEPSLDLESSWDILSKAFDKGLITEEQFLKAREQYTLAKTRQAVETLSKAFDNDQITEEQYFEYLKKAKTIASW